MRRGRVLAITGVVLVALAAGCSGAEEDPQGTTPPTQQHTQGPEGLDPETEQEMMPEGKPLGLQVTAPEGTKADPVPGLTVTVPQAAVEEDASTADLTITTYRMESAVDGIPALQVASAGNSQDSVYAETWVQETKLSTDPKISDIHRSQEQWPGATEAVAFGWKQQIPLQDGSMLDAEVLTLWLRDTTGHSFKLTAMAPDGELSGSPVENALLSATLTAEN